MCLLGGKAWGGTHGGMEVQPSCTWTTVLQWLSAERCARPSNRKPAAANNGNQHNSHLCRWTCTRASLTEFEQAYPPKIQHDRNDVGNFLMLCLFQAQPEHPIRTCQHSTSKHPEPLTPDTVNPRDAVQESSSHFRLDAEHLHPTVQGGVCAPLLLGQSRICILGTAETFNNTA